MANYVPNQYDRLLERVVAAHEGREPAPTIVVYNEEHMATLRAGLARAKKQLSTILALMGEDTLDSYQFKYSRSTPRRGEVTITLEPINRFQIQYVGTTVGAGSGAQDAHTQIPSGLGDSQAPR